MQSSRALVSIGIPTYNRVERLQNCLKKVLCQTYQNIEIIISDNASPDLAVKEVGERYQKIDNRIIYKRQEENIGIEANFNYVQSQAKGEYFIWMADDDYFDDNYIESCVVFLNKNPKHLHVSGTPKYYSEGQYLFTEKSLSFESDSPTIRLLSYLWCVQKNGIFYGLYRTKELSVLKLKPVVSVDICFIGQAIQLGKMKMIDNLYYHRSADGGTANRASIVKSNNLKGFKKMFLEPYIAYTIAQNVLLPNATTLKKLMLQPLVFILFNGKLVINSIKKRLPKKG